MKIPHKYIQFEAKPALFISSGEYEAHFFIAHKGEIKEEKTIKMPPRNEAKEKQGFVAKSRGLKIGAVSHRGTYVTDLKNKFGRNIHDEIHDNIANHHFEEIYLFAPKQVSNRIIENLDKSERKKISMQFYKEYTKYSPLLLLENLQKEINEIQKLATKTPGDKHYTGFKQ